MGNIKGKTGVQVGVQKLFKKTASSKVFETTNWPTILKELDSLPVKERWRLHEAMLPAVEHNYNHFFNGGLTDQLWPELLNMLNELRS